MAFDPALQMLHCSSCGTVRCPEKSDRARPWSRPAPMAEMRYQPGEISASGIEQIESTTITCPACGAEHQVRGDTVASVCQFCTNALVHTAPHVHRHPKPHGIIPFALAEQEAHDAIAETARSVSTPRGLKQFIAERPKLWGTYVSFYVFGGTVSGEYTARSRQNNRSGTWTGTAYATVENLLVGASDTAGITSRLAERAIPNWDPATLRPWRDDYLAGFHAVLPAISVDAGRQEAERLFAQAFSLAAAKDAGLNNIVQSIRYSSGAVTWRPVMLPMWLGQYQCRGGTYLIAVNGQSGETNIEAPSHGWWPAALATLAVLSLIAYLLSKGQ
jgi:hypothetical protein